jgi:DNA-binding MarR family transcriptional regulator
MSAINKDTDATQPICNCQALRQAARRLTQFYDHALAPAGLRVTQFPILASLAASGPMTLKALAEKMVMDRATLGHNVRPLQARGLIALTVGADRRSRLVELTDEGRSAMENARGLWRDAQRSFERSFGPQEAVVLRAALGRVAAMEYAA